MFFLVKLWLVIFWAPNWQFSYSLFCGCSYLVFPVVITSWWFHLLFCELLVFLIPFCWKHFIYSSSLHVMYSHPVTQRSMQIWDIGSCFWGYECMELCLHCHVCLNGMVPECRHIYKCFPFMCHGVYFLNLTSRLVDVGLLCLWQSEMQFCYMLWLWNDGGNIHTTTDCSCKYIKVIRMRVEEGMSV